MADFELAYSLTMKNEGGWVNDPRDSGGETFAGISRRNWPLWAGWPIVDRIKATKPANMDKALFADKVLMTLVKSFYKANFWDTFRGDKLPQIIANELFDSGVNFGTSVANKWLQRGLNALNLSGKTFGDLKIDGIIGSVTLSTVGLVDSKLLYKVLNILQGARYIEIMEHNGTQEVFARSWFSRVDIIK